MFPIWSRYIVGHYFCFSQWFSSIFLFCSSQWFSSGSVVFFFQQDRVFFSWLRNLKMTRLVMVVNCRRRVSSNSPYLAAGTERADKKTDKNCNNSPQTLYSSQEVYSSNLFLHEDQEEKPCQSNEWRQIDGQTIRVWWLLILMPFPCLKKWQWRGWWFPSNQSNHVDNNYDDVVVDSVKFAIDVDMKTGNSCNKNPQTLFTSQEVFKSINKNKKNSSTTEDVSTKNFLLLWSGRHKIHNHTDSIQKTSSIFPCSQSPLFYVQISTRTFTRTHQVFFSFLKVFFPVLQVQFFTYNSYQNVSSIWPVLQV